MDNLTWQLVNNSHREILEGRTTFVYIPLTEEEKAHFRLEQSASYAWRIEVPTGAFGGIESNKE